ncbi:hypothetical protein KN811_01285 [Sinomicrobium sp. 2019215]|nr:hypothetical protein [Sinomicrobium weinanense]MBU3122023.1 hypothetical protein [Sinomicrobium weinanense]
MYWLEAFVYQAEYPESTNPKGIYVIFTDDPEVMEAGFDAGNHRVFPKKEVYSGEKDIVRYGETIPLYLETHRLPDLTLDYHNYGLFEITVYAAKNNQPVSDTLTFKQNSESDPVTFNGLTRIDLPVQEEWRDKIGHQPNTREEFYAKIQPYLEYNPNTTGEKKPDEKLPVGILTNEALTQIKYGSKAGKEMQAPNGQMVLVSYNRANPQDFATPEQYHYLAEQINKGTLMLASVYQKNKIGDEMRTTNTFLVPWDTQADILQRRQTKVGDKMAAIADLSYGVPGIEPCKYTAIKLKVGDKEEIDIFNEEGENGFKDDTHLVYGVIAGDKQPETVIITLDKLKHAGTPVQCLKSEGEKHDSIQKVIGIAQDATEQWLEEGKKDDVTEDSRSKYSFLDNGIEIYLKYPYNKSYDNQVLDFLAYKTDALKNGILDENLKNIWVVRYLIRAIKGEKLYQPYYIPVHTCRYPSQVVRLHVYPDMKWVLNFNYNIDSPLYYEGTTELKDYYSGFNEGDVNTSNNNERKEILDNLVASELQRDVGRKTSFGLYVECEINGGSTFKLGDKFAEKYRKMLAPLLWIVNKIDNDFNISEAKEEDARLKRSANRGLMARLNALPMSFELLAPAVGAGIGIGYGLTDNYQAGYALEGRIIADPIIGANVKLDILALGSKFKPWGAIIDALDIASWLANFLSGGAVELNYELYVSLTAKILLVGADSEDDENTPARVNYHFKDKKYDGTIALQGRLEGEIVASSSFKYNVLDKKGRKFRNHRTRDAKEKAFELGIEAKAESFVTLTLGKNFGRQDNFESDFYFSGVNLKIKIKMGYKGTDKDLKLLPDVNKTFDVIKNKGEVE